MSTSTDTPPASVARWRYITKYGSKTITSSPGVDHAAEGQEQCARRARRDQHLAVGVTELGVDRCLDLGPQLGDALGDRVGVVAGPNRLDGRGLDRVGDVEIRQADREVDRVFHRLGHVERLADARGVDVLHPVGDPGVVHGFSAEWWSMVST